MSNDQKPQFTRIASYGLVLDEGQLLLCRISKGLPDAGTWTLPGGGLEFGEHPEEGMIREIEEETGLNVRATALAGIDSISGEDQDRHYHGIRIIYHAERLGGSLRNELNGSTDLCQWHALAEVADLPVVGLVSSALSMIDHE